LPASGTSSAPRRHARHSGAAVRSARRRQHWHGASEAAVRSGLRAHLENRMSAIFTINFRREVFVRERARSRARLLSLGGWLFYFGLLGMIVGLYALNCVALTRRALQVEHQTSHLAAAQGGVQDWTVDQTQLAAVERYY